MQSTRRTCSNSSSSRSVMRLHNTLTMPWHQRCEGVCLLREARKQACAQSVGRTFRLPRRRACRWLLGRNMCIRKRCGSCPPRMPAFIRNAQPTRRRTESLCTIHSDPIPSHPIPSHPTHPILSKQMQTQTQRRLFTRSLVVWAVRVSACVRAPRFGLLCVQHSEAHRRA